MAKGKSLKSNPLKRKDDSGATVEETVDIKVNKKKKKMMAKEEAPAQIPSITKTIDDRKPKRKKKNRMNPQTEQTEIPDPQSHLKGTDETKGLGDLSPEEKRVLERKLKKIRKKEERKMLKAEGVILKKIKKPSGPSACQQALNYLTCWAESRSAWKFQKTRQTWLLQHMYDSEQIPDEKFSVLLQYLEGLCGSGKDTTVQKALFVVEESGKAPEDEVVQQRAQRAREVIQLLA
ncbi:protein cholesin [Pholidichthys leucotaenia]